MIKLFKNKKEIKSAIVKPLRYIAYAEVLQDGGYVAWKTLFEAKLFSEEQEAIKHAEEYSKYYPIIVAEIKPLYKYKANPVVEILK